MKVTRSAVVNAASIARMVLTTESAVVDKPEAAGSGPRGRPRARARSLTAFPPSPRCGWVVLGRPTRTVVFRAPSVGDGGLDRLAAARWSPAAVGCARG